MWRGSSRWRTRPLERSDRPHWPGGRRQIQPKREFGASKSKSMKAKWLSLAFFYFLESGLFKWLQAKKIKKSLFVLIRALGCAQLVSNSHSFLTPARLARRLEGKFR
jgi:hypothetical protein